MKKVILRILTVILILLILAAVVIRGYDMIIKSRLSGLDLTSARGSRGGGMTGGHSSITFTKEAEGTKVVTEEQEWHNSDLTRVTYMLPADAMEQLKDLIIKNRINVLSRRGYSKMRVLDGDTSSLSCSFGADYSFYVHQEMKKSAAESKKFYGVRTLMYDLIKDAEGSTEVIPGGNAESLQQEGFGVSSSTETFGNFRKLCEPVI